MTLGRSPAPSEPRCPHVKNDCELHVENSINRGGRDPFMNLWIILWVLPTESGGNNLALLGEGCGIEQKPRGTETLELSGFQS